MTVATTNIDMSVTPGPENTRIAVAIASFNRCSKTLRCLGDLMSQERSDLQLSVYLLDDASTDGTAQAVAKHFPNVTVLHGTGSRYWSGGMFDAMSAALANKFDFLLLLNDDVELRPDALQRMLDAHAMAVRKSRGGMHLIVGAFVDPDTGKLAYSGFIRPSRLFPARMRQIPSDPDNLVACDTMNGNCVLIPAEVIDRIGIIDNVFDHQLGDIDYGYRAVNAGAHIWIAPDNVGKCLIGPRPKKWVDANLSIQQRWRLVNHPKGWPLKPWLHFMWRHGKLVGLASLAFTYAKALAGR